MRSGATVAGSALTAVAQVEAWYAVRSSMIELRSHNCVYIYTLIHSYSVSAQDSSTVCVHMAKRQKPVARDRYVIVPSLSLSLKCGLQRQVRTFPPR